MLSPVLSCASHALSHFIFSHKQSDKYFYCPYFVEEDFEYQFINLFTQDYTAK